MIELKFARRGVLAGALSAAVAPAAQAASGAGGSAADFVDQERALATAENKRLVVVFFASWCVWCRFMDMLLADRTAARILDPRFRFAHLRALEHDEDQRALQLNGANDVFARYAAARNGLPFLVFLDANGDVVTTTISSANDANIGFPVQGFELDWFTEMLALAAPDLTAQDLATLRAICVRLAPRRR
ncbi:MAG: thioredoxin family protein [Terricaulis sp.]